MSAGFTKQFDTPEEVNTRYQLEKRVRRKGQLRGRHEALDKETGDE